MKLTPTLETRRVGDLLIICNEETRIPHLEDLEGIEGIIDHRLKQEFAAWVAKEQVSDVARQLGISRAKAGRLRKALGLAEEYPRDSRTTLWRRKQS